jgi:hypothetical protein
MKNKGQRKTIVSFSPYTLRFIFHGFYWDADEHGYTPIKDSPPRARRRHRIRKRNNGTMEYWNDGPKKRMLEPIIPSFHYSNIPVSLLCGESLRRIISSLRSDCQSLSSSRPPKDFTRMISSFVFRFFLSRF